MNATDTTRRQGYIDGLRRLADQLETNPAIPLPYAGNDGPLSIYTRTLEQAAAALDLVENPAHSIDASTDYKARVRGHCAGVEVVVYIADEIALLEPVPMQPRLNPALFPDGGAA